MMPGLASKSNGLDPHAVDSARQKCPDHPTKRKFATMHDAEVAAAHSSKQYRKTVVPYACAGCGLFHVTGKLDGSDVLTMNRNGGVQTAAMQQREALRLVDSPPPARIDVSAIVAGERPIVPANRAAREKFLVAYLAERDRVATTDIATLLHCSTDTVRILMRAQGWSIPRGPGGRWHRPGTPAWPAHAPTSAKTPGQRAARAARADSSHVKPVQKGRAIRWADLPDDMTIGQTRQMLKALGMTGELRVW